jgi:hypothetical protein
VLKYSRLNEIPELRKTCSATLNLISLPVIKVKVFILVIVLFLDSAECALVEAIVLRPDGYSRQGNPFSRYDYLLPRIQIIDGLASAITLYPCERANVSKVSRK